MKPILFTLFSDESSLCAELLNSDHFELGEADIRRFPDGESYVRVTSQIKDRNIIILANLHHPDDKLLPVLFLCQSLRDQSAKHITLIAPYLPYMRQDKRFHSGECITSAVFANILSTAIDELVTIDPHLHRYHALSEIYSTKTQTLKADNTIANWIKRNIQNPLIIGPDSESEQWAAATAEMIDCPHLVLTKERFGDRDVSISYPNAATLADRTPVLVDDIISTGRTMIETAGVLTSEGFKAPVCIGVHAVFSENDYQALANSDVEKVVTCNTIQHHSNGIDLSEVIINALRSQRV
ncbi:ribose-phosphate pyrophosphokinase [Alkalimarinus alittae]|uniref:Ribose-phosphate pyrophosphokinase n=1 Tax=Alkalimarinus alittae TaxID=2961619 RepID=A0ABY6MZ91_9ALTE|nr:ribose-phosphate pyrophosphokinase [Alkalimarinus alittae]UZE95148.1 ribose-phosphate pyrophosphokinase [Alkalimarinus alittae]